MWWVGIELHDFHRSLSHFYGPGRVNNNQIMNKYFTRRELESRKGSRKTEVTKIIPIIALDFGATINLIFFVCN